MREFILKTLIIVFAVIFSLWLIKINHLEPGIRVKNYEWKRTFLDDKW